MANARGRSSIAPPSSPAAIALLADGLIRRNTAIPNLGMLDQRIAS